MIGASLVQQFVVDRARIRAFSHDTLLREIFDSLAFLDLFLALEEAQLPLTLDDVAGCATLGELETLVSRV